MCVLGDALLFFAAGSPLLPYFFIPTVQKLPLPFKGRDGVGMGLLNPIPLLTSPLKGEGRIAS